MSFCFESLSEQFLRCEKVFTALHTLKEGKLLILTDDEDRENEGDFIFAAEDSTKEKINFLIKEARGLVCLALAPHLIDKLELPLMRDPRKNSPLFETAFTFSIESKEGVTTGISASDRNHTILTAIADNVKPSDLAVPGHVFPLRAQERGVLDRCGHTEASTDLMLFAGKKPAAVLCEILRDDGEMARGEELELLSKKHNIPKLSIADLIIFRMLKEKVLEITQEKTLSEDFQKLHMVSFTSLIDEKTFVTLTNTREEESELEILWEEKTFSHYEGKDDHFSSSLFLSKQFFSENKPRLFILCLSHADTGNQYEQRKKQGFLSKILTHLSLHKSKASFRYGEKSLNPKWLDLNLAQKETISYKEPL